MLERKEPKQIKNTKKSDENITSTRHSIRKLVMLKIERKEEEKRKAIRGGIIF